MSKYVVVETQPAMPIKTCKHEGENESDIVCARTTLLACPIGPNKMRYENSQRSIIDTISNRHRRMEN